MLWQSGTDCIAFGGSSGAETGKAEYEASVYSFSDGGMADPDLRKERNFIRR